MRLHSMVVIALCATTAAACKGRQTAEGATRDNATAAALTVRSVELGRSIDADRRIQGGTTTFRRGDTIYAVVETSGESSGTLQARWTYQDGQVVDQSSQSIAASDSRTEFHISKPDGWPAGKYRLELLQNGAVVETKEFEVSR